MRPMNLRSALSDVRRHKTGSSNVSYIANGRLAEESSVFSIELARAFLADFEGRGRRVDPVVQHTFSSHMQWQFLLKL
jgi:hypothetical protein